MQAEENGKIFPATRRSADVLAVLIAECEKQGVRIRCGEAVQEISRGPDSFSLTGGAGTYHASSVVITTGGASYPQCGTTGDGYRLASGLGQPVTEIAPALTPLHDPAVPVRGSYGTLL